MHKKTRPSSLPHAVLYTTLGIALVCQLCLLFLLPLGEFAWLIPTGWTLFAVSALLGWLPILVFRRHGRVVKGKSYIHTTELVTSGLYAIVRHPQFLASDFLALAVMCITQHWGVYLAGTVAIAANHLTMNVADRDLVAKFGDPYRRYAAQVPQWNPFVGVYRLARRRLRSRSRP